MSSVGTKLGDDCDPDDDCDDSNGICNGTWICDSPYVELEGYCGKLDLKI